jgi:PhnB protein
MIGKTKPIPEGFHAITPYLVVRGVSEAIDYYKRAFGAVERYRMASPDGNTIMHAEITIGDSIIMLSDECPEMDSKSPAALQGTPVSIHLYVEDVDEVFERAVREGAKVTMPLENTFWGDRFGALTDPFGHHWSIASHMEDLPPEEIARRGAEKFGGKAANA